MSHAIKYDFVYHLYFSDGTPIFTSWQKSISNFFIHVLFCFQPFVLNRKPIFSINMVFTLTGISNPVKDLSFFREPPSYISDCLKPREPGIFYNISPGPTFVVDWASHGVADAGENLFIWSEKLFFFYHRFFYDHKYF